MSRVFQALERTEGLRGRKTSAILDAPTARRPSRPAEPVRYRRVRAARRRDSPRQGRGTIHDHDDRLAASWRRDVHGGGGAREDPGRPTPGAARRRQFPKPRPHGSAARGQSRAPVSSRRWRAQPTSRAIITETGVPGLRLVAAGAVDSESPRLLQTSRLAPLMSQLAETTDVVILDAPPVMPYADALTLASKVERVVLVTQCGTHTARPPGAGEGGARQERRRHSRCRAQPNGIARPVLAPAPAQPLILHPDDRSQSRRNRNGQLCASTTFRRRDPGSLLLRRLRRVSAAPP